jgi:outer membrane immunogenic protein
MKSLAFAAALLTSAALVAAPAAAQEGMTASLGYTHYDGDEVDVGGVTGRLGYRFHPNFGVEGEATFGVNDDDVDVLGTNVNVELDNAYGVYGVGYLPVSQNVDLFARAGWAKVEASGSSGPFTAELEEDGVGVGAGVQWRFGERVGLRAEYTRLEGEDDGVDTYGLSLATQF